MKDGYYLSAYISIDKLGNLYEFMSNRHDMGIALWNKKEDDVELVKYWELERLTGMKHHQLPAFDNEAAYKLISDLLSKENIRTDQINEIWGCPKLEKSGIYKGNDYYFHSIAHLYSSLLIDTDIFYKEKIIGFSLDLRSDNDTEERRQEGFNEYVGCFSNKGEITYFAIGSPAVLWCLCKGELGMQEGSLMALASATDCKFKESIKVEEPIDFKYPDYDKAYKIYDQIFKNLSIDKVENYNDDLSLRDNLISAGMKEIIRLSLELMDNEVQKVLDRFHLKASDVYLSLSGGFGLNCPTNSYLMKKYGFKGFLGAPCMDDSGQALGIGLFNFYMANNKKVNFKLRHAFYGDSNEHVEESIDWYRKKGFIKSVDDFDEDEFVNDIKDDVIVWVDSNAEIGPRALGHRSLLGDPTKIETKNRLNQIKQRQFWRPVAPIVLREFVDDWFEEDVDSPYMLQTAIVKPEKRKEIPAILHYDNSARLQTIENIKETSCLYNAILKFYEKTGVPIVCNTSLNDKGEPIIHSAYNAIRFAIKKKIRIVYINNKRIELRLNSLGSVDFPSIYDINLQILSKEYDEQVKLNNPFGIDKNYLIWKDMFPFDIRTKQGAERYKRSVELIYKKRPDIERVYRFF